MELFGRKNFGDKLKEKQEKVQLKIQGEFSKTTEILKVMGIDLDGVEFALRAHPVSLTSVTRPIWVIYPNKLVKVSGLPPAYSKESYLFSDIDSISISNELIPNIALRCKGRYLTFQADKLHATYFTDLVNEKLQMK